MSEESNFPLSCLLDPRLPCLSTNMSHQSKSEIQAIKDMEKIRNKTEEKTVTQKIIPLLSLEDFCSLKASVFDF